MNLMFWKKKTTTEDSEDDSQEKLGDRRVSQKSLGPESRYRKTSEDTHGETADVSPAHPKRHLIIGAAIGMLILAAIGLTTWKIFLPSPKQDTTTADTPTLILPIPLPEKQLIKLPPIEFPQLRKAQAKDHQTDIEALKKKNDALQTQIEGLKIDPPQVENPQSVSRQANIDALTKRNNELQTQIGVLKAELPQVEKAQAKQHQANIDALTKKNNELQTQIGVLIAELPQIEKAQAEQHQANIDALTKKNNELQAQIEALKKKQQQQPSASPANQAAGKAQPPIRSGEIAIGNKNLKVMTLKEVIEAMNADSGDPPKKPAK